MSLLASCSFDNLSRISETGLSPSSSSRFGLVNYLFDLDPELKEMRLMFYSPIYIYLMHLIKVSSIPPVELTTANTYLCSTRCRDTPRRPEDMRLEE
jgi:hypothetical protein